MKSSDIQISVSGLSLHSLLFGEIQTFIKETICQPKSLGITQLIFTVLYTVSKHITIKLAAMELIKQACFKLHLQHNVAYDLVLWLRKATVYTHLLTELVPVPDGFCVSTELQMSAAPAQSSCVGERSRKTCLELSFWSFAEQCCTRTHDGAVFLPEQGSDSCGRRKPAQAAAVAPINLKIRNKITNIILRSKM